MQSALQNTLQESPDTQRTCQFISRWENIHALYLSTLNENWRQYINYLDEEVQVIFDQVILTKADPDATHERSFVENSLANVKRLQYLIDQTSRACHMLDLNSTVMKTLMRTSEHVSQKEASSNIKPEAAFAGQVQSIFEECQVHYKSANSLLARATNISQHLRDVIAMRNNEFIKMMTLSTTQGNEVLLELSRKAVSEAQSMKAITIVALIYVPASFVADFLQMGYVSTAHQKGLVVSATNGLLLYAVITLPLVIVTMGIYFLLELINRRLRLEKQKPASEKILDVV